MAGNAAQDKEIGQHVDDVGGLQLAVHPDCQGLMGELVDDIEHAVFPRIVGAVLNEIVGPDMVGAFGYVVVR